MNRKDRRRAGVAKDSKDAIVMYKEKDFEAMFEQTKQVTTRLVTRGLLAAFAISLNDEFEFSTKRVNRVLDSTRAKFADIISNHLTLDDVEDWCHEKNIVLE